MSKRDPEILSARAGEDAKRLGTGHSEDQRGSVLLPVYYRGLRGDHVDEIVLTPAEARRNAIALLQAADRADQLAVERGERPVGERLAADLLDLYATAVYLPDDVGVLATDQDARDLARDLWAERS